MNGEAGRGGGNGKNNVKSNEKSNDKSSNQCGNKKNGNISADIGGNKGGRISVCTGDGKARGKSREPVCEPPGGIGGDRQRKILGVIMAAVLLVSMYLVAREGAATVNSDKILSAGGEKEKICVVIDAGHGGADPGKVGINGALEKDINLKIAAQLKKFLEAEDLRVVLTRTDDGGLYEESDSNKKVQDMKKRIALIEEAQPELVVSVHQNSYHEEYVHGAQVFYYNGSQSGKELAELIQKRFVAFVDPENKREAKANDSYYLLKKTSRPIVIVECGFLSNREEAEKLNSEIYQQKAAWAIHMGILQYLNRAG